MEVSQIVQIGHMIVNNDLRSRSSGLCNHSDSGVYQSPISVWLTKPIYPAKLSLQGMSYFQSAAITQNPSLSIAELEIPPALENRNPCNVPIAKRQILDQGARKLSSLILSTW
jgi:hypothetical protein